MANTIIEVQTIIPATGWLFGDADFLEGHLSDYKPVVFFVQVLTFDNEYPTLGVQKFVIPLDAEDYSDINNLIGEDIVRFQKDLFNASQFPVPERDDD
jgi:hypothetical protein